MREIAILYICTGRYVKFWREFYLSSEKFFLNSGNYVKKYFVFTDSPFIEFEENPRVTRIFQEKFSWPYATLYRFKIFKKACAYLEQSDYIYFFNANMVFLKEVDGSILPEAPTNLAFLEHPLLYNKRREEFTYETNPSSLACISANEGERYFMGALNGGESKAYLRLIDELGRRIEIDESRGIIAIWHDESHLNRYAIDNKDYVKALDPSYGYPEGRSLPFEPRILILDKRNHGGHAFLRDEKQPWYSKLLGAFSRI